MKKFFFVISLSVIAAILTLLSCSEDRNFANSYSPHINGWMDPASPDFHGKAAMSDSNKSCASCHDLRAGFHLPEPGIPSASASACIECHQYPHPGAFGTFTAFHHDDIIDSSWNLAGCMDCHGINFAGGRTGVSCNACHTAENGPANCTTCHGIPPVDNFTVLAAGPMRPSGAAGDHYHHAVQKGYTCTECHAGVTDMTHTGPLPAEVSFANAVIATARGYADTSYIHVGAPVSGNGACAVYCHSNGRGDPPNQPVPEWTSGVQLTCTACHSVPPALPHPQLNQCHNCHQNVDPSSTYPNNIRFLVEQLHVNGIVEL